MTTITYDLLSQQNADTSNAIIEYWKTNTKFEQLAKYEGQLTIQRDQEDDEKLQKGIDYAKSKGVIDPEYVPEPYMEIDVLGKTPDQVADHILDSIQTNKDSNASGSVIVLCGLSGTGKGTTVSKLRQKLEDQKQKVVTWSNGNIFRSVTLLAATWCEQNLEDKAFDATKALTKENLESFVNMLSFQKSSEGLYDTHINGLGYDDLKVSEVQNTVLKSPLVSKNIPTVAEVTQGEVILFAAKAVDMMGQDGFVVLLEGRAQTVNYVKSPHRFTLMLSDDTLIGKRRAAQRVMAEAVKTINADATDEQIASGLESVLDEISKDVVV
eukprot:CAMPEP_0119552740 /NCGR_PEP_ID=MMETSP1352-20130426/5663_1 /TAXON_ID=265584 /ORGANISM="Stauroneis constricta, Strain CCMP1120" /LENGTH=324 /DNA_ID=CAMNT_0007599021 /DNA_START=125 /DNA_END=1099 /DNA_ORIENTATION=-